MTTPAVITATAAASTSGQAATTASALVTPVSNATTATSLLIGTVGQVTPTAQATSSASLTISVRPFLTLTAAVATRALGIVVIPGVATSAAGAFAGDTPLTYTYATDALSLHGHAADIALTASLGEDT